MTNSPKLRYDFELTYGEVNQRIAALCKAAIFPAALDYKGDCIFVTYDTFTFYTTCQTSDLELVDPGRIPFKGTLVLQDYDTEPVPPHTLIRKIFKVEDI